MRKEKGVQNIVIVVLAVAILVMSVGFALYSQNLNITGHATFEKAKWDVHFDTGTNNANFNETSTIKASSKTIANTSIEYTVTLPKPGDSYSFTIPVKNFGTIDAKLTSITMSTLTEAQAKFITYKLSYAGTDYTQTTTGLSDVLAAGASKNVVVTVTYNLPANAEDLPTEQDVTVDLTAQLHYEDNISSGN